jgi:hypothetical protein
MEGSVERAAEFINSASSNAMLHAKRCGLIVTSSSYRFYGANEAMQRSFKWFQQFQILHHSISCIFYHFRMSMGHCVQL